MNLIHHDHGIVKEAPAVLVHRTGILFQGRGGYTIVTDKGNTVLNGGDNLLANVRAFLGADLGVIVVIGGLFKIGDPDDTAVFFGAAQDFIEVFFRERKDVTRIVIDGGGFIRRGEGLFDPVVVHIEMLESAEGDFRDKVGSKGKGGHDNNLLVGRAIQGLCGGDGRAGFS